MGFDFEGSDDRIDWSAEVAECRNEGPRKYQQLMRRIYQAPEEERLEVFHQLSESAAALVCRLATIAMRTAIGPEHERWPKTVVDWPRQGKRVILLGPRLIEPLALQLDVGVVLGLARKTLSELEPWQAELVANLAAFVLAEILDRLVKSVTTPPPTPGPQLRAFPDRSPHPM